jgi:hypothetical protein
MWDDKLLISVLAGIMLVSLFVYGWLGGSFIGAETLARLKSAPREGGMKNRTMAAIAAALSARRGSPR